MERTIYDINNIHKGYINKNYYHKCPDNPKYYRTIYVGWDAFNQRPRAYMSNPVFGEPNEDTHNPISSTMLSNLLRMNGMGGFMNNRINDGYKDGLL